MQPEQLNQETEAHVEPEHKKGHHKEDHGDHKKECKDCKKLREHADMLEEENAKLSAAKAEWEDAYKRKVAEFDNYRKRMLKQVEDCSTEASKKLILEILPIFDNFERGLSAAAQNQDFKTLFDGLKITHSQFNSLFERLGITAIDSLNTEFDHNLHEALMMEEREDVEFDNTVVAELEKGYRIGEAVLRHSKVKVAKKKK